jgi:uncharacterized membrane protein
MSTQHSGHSYGDDQTLRWGSNPSVTLVDRHGQSAQQRSGAASPVAERVARGLGWLGLGIGIAAAARPDRLGRLVGVETPERLTRIFGLDNHERHRGIMRLIGLREIVQGAGLLTASQPGGWVWSRVAGDMMDLAYLGTQLYSCEAKRRDRLIGSIAAVAGMTIVDFACAMALSRGSDTMGRRGIRTRKTVTIKRSPEEVYHFWHDFQNLPRFMNHLESVQITGPTGSHWKARGPAGRTVEWDAEMIDDQPNELIVWRSLANANVHNAGQVRFRPAPGDRGTEVEVDLWYDPPGGKIGSMIARLMGEEPGQQISSDLRRLKQLLETGETIRSDATLVGHAVNRWGSARVAPDPPSRRAPRRRSRRFPSHTKGVGAWFHPISVSSNHPMISSGVCGCCPASARRTMIRCSDSAIFSHEPLSGVYNGMTPCWNNHRTIDQLRCPAKLSQIRSKRSGGNGSRGSCPSQVTQCASSGRSISGVTTSGNAARIWVSSSFSQGWSTVLGALVTPFPRTSPVAGRKSVRSLAVPLRTYSWAWRMGSPTGCHPAPG